MSSRWESIILQSLNLGLPGVSRNNRRKSEENSQWNNLYTQSGHDMFKESSQIDAWINWLYDWANAYFKRRAWTGVVFLLWRILRDTVKM